MMNQQTNEQFEQKVKSSLNSTVDNLDADTRKRLADMRRQALNAKAHNTKWLSVNYWLPAGALSMCSLFALFLLFSPQHKDALPVQHEQIAMFELLNNADELDVMTDLDFYAWMDESLDENLDEIPTKDIEITS